MSVFYDHRDLEDKWTDAKVVYGTEALCQDGGPTIHAWAEHFGPDVWALKKVSVADVDILGFRNQAISIWREGGDVWTGSVYLRNPEYDHIEDNVIMCGRIPSGERLPLQECTDQKLEFEEIPVGFATCRAVDFQNFPQPFPDEDGDGVPDEIDNCLGVFNPDQADQDGDGLGDACDICPDDPRDPSGNLNPDDICDFCYPDVDPDGDKVCSNDDNCPLVPNPDQNDTNGDGEGDACVPLTECAICVESIEWVGCDCEKNEALYICSQLVELDNEPEDRRFQCSYRADELEDIGQDLANGDPPSDPQCLYDFVTAVRYQVDHDLICMP